MENYIGEVAAGTYTDIISITAPASAKYGDAVSVTVKVKNIFSLPLNIAITGKYNGVNISFSPSFKSVGAGATYSFTSSFTMPNKSIKLDVWSSFWVDYVGWYQDDYEYVNITLAAVYKGTITKKELDYQDRWQAFPLYNIPTGTRTRVRITGRNDMTTTQRMGIYWIVKAPDGVTIQEYSAWEALPYTGAGSTHEFIGGSFDLNKVGTYKIDVALNMNPSSPEVVDTYYGTLCSVAAVVPEPEFQGFGIVEYSEV